MLGIEVAMIELFLFFGAAYSCRENYKPLKNIDTISYYWLAFTILTFIWETSYIIHYDQVHDYSMYLIRNNETVWKNNYKSSAIIPWNLAKIFYAEYAAYADREYMLLADDWSRVIEGTHAYICGIFSIMALSYKIDSDHKNYLISASVSMGSQAMNSILYMSNYIIKTSNPHNINYCRPTFKCGNYLSTRPFMYINIFWTAMPMYVLWKLINRKNRGSIKFNIRRYISMWSNNSKNKKIKKEMSNLIEKIPSGFGALCTRIPYYQQ